jgi:hypothetical protein
MRCDSCLRSYPAGERFCATCGNALTVPTFWQEWRPALLLLVIGLAVGGFLLVFVVAVSKLPPQPRVAVQSPIATPSAVDSKSRSTHIPVATPEKRVVTENALASFRSKLMSLPDSELLILSVQGSEVPGVARVQVSNVWYNSQPYQRRQITKMMANLWEAEMGGQTAILHIYDITGREIAGTKAFGGVWTEDD